MKAISYQAMFQILSIGWQCELHDIGHYLPQKLNQDQLLKKRASKLFKDAICIPNCSHSSTRKYMEIIAATNSNAGPNFQTSVSVCVQCWPDTEFQESSRSEIVMNWSVGCIRTHRKIGAIVAVYSWGDRQPTLSGFLCIRPSMECKLQVFLHTADLHVTVGKQFIVIQFFLLKLQGRKQAGLETLYCGVCLQI